MGRKSLLCLLSSIFRHARECDPRMSFAHWRRRIRFHRAVDALVAGRPIAEVAHNNGYRSASAFTAAFRKSMGMAPSQIHKHEH